MLAAKLNRPLRIGPRHSMGQMSKEHRNTKTGAGLCWTFAWKVKDSKKNCVSHVDDPCISLMCAKIKKNSIDEPCHSFRSRHLLGSKLPCQLEQIQLTHWQLRNTVWCCCGCLSNAGQTLHCRVCKFYSRKSENKHRAIATKCWRQW